jgi:hypothetical protein
VGEAAEGGDLDIGFGLETRMTAGDERGEAIGTARANPGSGLSADSPITAVRGGMRLCFVLESSCAVGYGCIADIRRG